MIDKRCTLIHFFRLILENDQHRLHSAHITFVLYWKTINTGSIQHTLPSSYIGKRSTQVAFRTHYLRLILENDRHRFHSAHITFVLYWKTINTGSIQHTLPSSYIGKRSTQVAFSTHYLRLILENDQNRLHSAHITFVLYWLTINTGCIPHTLPSSYIGKRSTQAPFSTHYLRLILENDQHRLHSAHITFVLYWKTIDIGSIQHTLPSSYIGKRST